MDIPTWSGNELLIMTKKLMTAFHVYVRKLDGKLLEPDLSLMFFLPYT